MTIRQIGGVFGRHPSFQDVETDDLQVTQSVDFSAASQVDLGTSTSKIAVSINSAADQFYMERPGTGETWSLQHNGGLVTHQIGTSTGIRWMKDGSEMARLRFGNLSVGTTDITRRLNIGGDIGLTGNVIVANGKGIDFSATSGAGTSELFDDYEEGTWTPAWTNLTVGDGTSTGRYTKFGRTVFVEVDFLLGSTSVVGSSPEINNLPFVSDASFVAYGAGGYSDAGTATHEASCLVPASSARLIPQRFSVSGSVVFQSGLTATAPFTWTTNDRIRLTATYTAAG